MWVDVSLTGQWTQKGPRKEEPHGLCYTLLYCAFFDTNESEGVSVGALDLKQYGKGSRSCEVAQLKAWKKVTTEKMKYVVLFL